MPLTAAMMTPTAVSMTTTAVRMTPTAARMTSSTARMTTTAARMTSMKYGHRASEKQEHGTGAGKRVYFEFLTVIDISGKLLSRYFCLVVINYFCYQMPILRSLVYERVCNISTLLKKVEYVSNKSFSHR